MTAAMATKRQILIVDDHPIVRQGLRRMFEAEPDLAVCGEADSEPVAREAIRARKPDIVVVDLSPAGGRLPVGFDLPSGPPLTIVVQHHARSVELAACHPFVGASVGVEGDQFGVRWPTAVGPGAGQAYAPPVD